MQIPGYRIIRKINQGGMSTVYLAIQLSVGREVALKVMSPILNADPVFSERFQREANIVGQLSHPNIVSIYDIGRYKNLNYIAMDYLSGGSVHDRMAAGLSIQEALRITREVALALEHAHEKGYIHRDIKPENILLREDNSAVLSDFGVAKTISKASRMTNAGTVVGTPHYMSPEQARGKPLDGRSDLYSLGVVFFEMLTGRVPYTAEEAVAIAIKHLTAPIPRLPPQHAGFQKILNKLLAKDADNRFQRGREVAQAIKKAEQNLLGNGRRYPPTTDPTAVEVMPLLKALLLTRCAALAAQAGRLLRFLFIWRGTQAQGLYHPTHNLVTKIRTQVNTEEANRPTLITPRLRKADYYRRRRPGGGSRYLSRCLAAVVVAGIVWTAFSIALERFDLPGKTLVPKVMWQAAVATAALVQYRAGTTAPAQPSMVSADGRAAAEEITATLPRFALTIRPEPTTARIRILNIRERYFPGIRLLPGRYHVEVTHPGYDPVYQWVTLGRRDLDHSIRLSRTPVPRNRSS